MNDFDIGTKIAKLRKERGFTQKDLAEFLGVTDKAVSRWESGAGNPDITLLPKLAKLLGVSTDYLLSVQPASSAFPAPARLRPNDSSGKPTRVLPTLAKVFAIFGSALRCAALFLLAFMLRNTSRWLPYYVIGNVLMVIDTILCWLTFVALRRARSKRPLIAIGVLSLIFCSVLAGIFLFAVPNRELTDPKTIVESDEAVHSRGKFIASTIVTGVGIAFIAVSIASFALEFFGKKGNYPAVNGYQVLFDYAHCFDYVKGSSGWLAFAYFGELLLLLLASAGSLYWFFHEKHRSPRKASFRSIIFIGSSFMVMGWLFGILIANCDSYTQYRANEIPPSIGIILAAVFCIVGSNLCGIGFMIPLRKIKRVSLEAPNE